MGAAFGVARLDGQRELDGAVETAIARAGHVLARGQADSGAGQVVPVLVESDKSGTQIKSKPQLDGDGAAKTSE
jgi:hypothetical protein